MLIEFYGWIIENSYIFLYPLDKELEKHLWYHIKIGIFPRTYQIVLHKIDEGFVVFNNGTSYEFWNRNRDYAWLKSGKFIFRKLDDNKKFLIETGSYQYNEGRPKLMTMFLFKKAIEESKWMNVKYINEL